MKWAHLHGGIGKGGSDVLDHHRTEGPRAGLILFLRSLLDNVRTKAWPSFDSKMSASPGLRSGLSFFTLHHHLQTQVVKKSSLLPRTVELILMRLFQL
jgi:hypothetical protein